MKLYKLEPDNLYFTNKSQVAKYLKIQYFQVDYHLNIHNGELGEHKLSLVEDEETSIQLKNIIA